MCDRIAIIDKGNLVALDTTQKLLDRIQTKKIIFTVLEGFNIEDLWDQVMKLLIAYGSLGKLFHLKEFLKEQKANLLYLI